MGDSAPKGGEATLERKPGSGERLVRPEVSHSAVFIRI